MMNEDEDFDGYDDYFYEYEDQLDQILEDIIIHGVDWTTHKSMIEREVSCFFERLKELGVQSAHIFTTTHIPERKASTRYDIGFGCLFSRAKVAKIVSEELDNECKY